MKVNSVSFCGIPHNYGIVDNVLSRSAQPDKEDFATLKDLGITDIIDFRTHITEHANLEDFNEKETVKKLGMKYHSIPSHTRHPLPENIQNFIDTVDKITKNGGKAHVHCQAGADRTGMYVFIYKWVKGMGTVSENVQEWLNFGHHKDLFPNLIDETIKLLIKMGL